MLGSYGASCQRAFSPYTHAIFVGKCWAAMEPVVSGHLVLIYMLYLLANVGRLLSAGI